MQHDLWCPLNARFVDFDALTQRAWGLVNHTPFTKPDASQNLAPTVSSPTLVFTCPPPGHPTSQLPNHFWELPCPHTTSRSIMSPWKPPSPPQGKKNVPQNLHPQNREVSIPWETPSSPFHDGATICPRQSLPVQETQVLARVCPPSAPWGRVAFPKRANPIPSPEKPTFPNES